VKKIVTLRQALDDPQYFGGQIAGPSWAPWRSLLLAIMGEPLTPDELATFTSLTGRLQAPYPSPGQHRVINRLAFVEFTA
jgi:hypothetical protein